MPVRRKRGPGPLFSRSGSRNGRLTRLVSKGGGEQWAAKPLAAGGLRRVRRVPPFWRPLHRSLTGGKKPDEQRVNGWLLVLSAKKIPHLFFPSGTAPRLYVPPLREGVALHEIRAFEAERPTPLFVPPVRDNAAGVVSFLALLFIWHGLRFHWFLPSLPEPPFPADPAAWSALFGLDMAKARDGHEWWRAFTALTLHSDDPHLFSNLGFGFLFLAALCRRAGLGLGLLLTLLAGFLGNVCNALTWEYTKAAVYAPRATIISLGFSTALFGALGAVCGLNAADLFGHHRRFAHLRRSGGGMVGALARRLLMPLAAGLALLGILGGGGEARTDYAAHIWGFCAGLSAALALLPLERRLFSLPEKKQARTQGLLFVLALALPVSAWLYAVCAR